jgi:LuxR family quorum-sensing transcriptional regulator LasR
MTIEHFIAATHTAHNVQQLFAVFGRAMAQRGFDFIVFSLMTDHPAAAVPLRHAILCSYPAKWMRHYRNRRYEAIDPVRQYLPAATGPFSWESLRGCATPEQYLCLQEAEAAGLKNGIAIPLRGPDGLLAGVGAASSRGDADTGRDNLAYVALLCKQFYACFMALQAQAAPPPAKSAATIAPHTAPPPENAPVKLSRRECEVLTLSARLDGRHAVAAALGIGDEAVKFHLKNIRRKLGTPTIITAILTAQRLGLIEI